MRQILLILLTALRIIIIILIFVIKFVFELIPSLIYGVSAWILMPIGLLSGLFMKRPNTSKKTLVTLKFSTAFLILIMPVILYLYVCKQLGWMFMVWMIVYFIIRLYSGAHKKEQMIRDGMKGLDALTQKYQPFYIENNLLISITTIILSIISLVVVGYLIGGEKGLWIGGIIAFFIFMIGQYQYKVKLKDTEEINRD